MSDKENKKEQKAAATNPGGTPLSQSIENAHASGDGALERDRDTILAPKEEGNDPDKGHSTGSNEAY